jgi:hypothetical protein
VEEPRDVKAGKLCPVPWPAHTNMREGGGTGRRAVRCTQSTGLFISLADEKRARLLAVSGSRSGAEFVIR